MMQVSYYHEILDGIFYELERYSAFRIAYRIVARTDESGDAFVLESVNRMKDPEIFGRALEKLITEARARIMTQMKSLSNRDQPLFFEEVLDRYLDLKKLVLEPGRTPALTVKSWGIDGDVYLFHPQRVKRGDAPDNLENIPVSVLSQATEFARTWFEQIDEAAARARAALAAASFRYEEANNAGCNPADSETEESSTHKSRGRPKGKTSSATDKIFLNCTVIRLGLHLKLLYEDECFPDTTKMDLCKTIAGIFYTKNQPNISYLSLKNAMDAPKERAIRLFREKWTDYLKKAEDKMSMN